MKIKMTVGNLRAAIKDLSDDTLVCYHGYSKGCCLTTYDLQDVWTYPKGADVVRAFVMNPGEDYDGRAAVAPTTKEPNEPQTTV